MQSHVSLSLKIRALLLTLFVACGLMAVSVTAPAAHANSDPTPTADYPWAHNGCSYVSDEPVRGASFTDACNKHDGCYGDHWASRSVCDAWFLSDMRNACAPLQLNSTWRFLRCRAVADLYYASARLFGESHYNSDWLSDRYDTPLNG
jgi:hypothetical protein